MILRCYIYWIHAIRVISKSYSNCRPIYDIIMHNYVELRVIYSRILIYAETVHTYPRLISSLYQQRLGGKSQYIEGKKLAHYHRHSVVYFLLLCRWHCTEYLLNVHFLWRPRCRCILACAGGETRASSWSVSKLNRPWAARSCARNFDRTFYFFAANRMGVFRGMSVITNVLILPLDLPHGKKQDTVFEALFVQECCVLCRWRNRLLSSWNAGAVRLASVYKSKLIVRASYYNVHRRLE